jgi:hypothetical protein
MDDLVDRAVHYRSVGPVMTAEHGSRYLNDGSRSQRQDVCAGAVGADLVQQGF